MNSAANPAAGASLSISAISNYISELAALSFILTNDANASDRYITIFLQRGGINQLLGSSFRASTASQVTYYYCHQNAGNPAAPNMPYHPIALPNLPNFLENDNLLVTVQGIQVGDQISAATVNWKLWIYPQ